MDDPAPRAIVMVGSAAACAKSIKLSRESGLSALFLPVSFVNSTTLARELGSTNAVVIATQIVPHPLSLELPLVREYQEDLTALDPSATPGFVSLEGYVAARILVMAIDRIAGPPSREAIADSLEGLGEFDLGLGEPLVLGPQEHQACHRVWPTILRDGTFAPFQWEDIASLLGKEATP